MTVQSVQVEINQSIDRHGLTAVLQALQVWCSQQADVRQDGWEQELEEIQELLEDCTRKSLYVDAPHVWGRDINTEIYLATMQVEEFGYFSRR